MNYWYHQSETDHTGAWNSNMAIRASSPGAARNYLRANGIRYNPSTSIYRISDESAARADKQFYTD